MIKIYSMGLLGEKYITTKDMISLFFQLTGGFKKQTKAVVIDKLLFGGGAEKFTSATRTHVAWLAKTATKKIV